MRGETTEYYNARITCADRWVPACGGSEAPFLTRSGVRLLYCWNPREGRHAYLNVETDMILTNEEARALLP